jgi:hypothetical protein
MKLTTEQKLETISTIVEPLYATNETHDTICGAVFTAGLHGIGFGEINALVKHWGEKHGFIVKLSERKDNALLDIESIATALDTYAKFETSVSDIAKQCNVPTTWVRNKLKAHYKSNEWDVPKKSTLLEWQRALVDCFLENPDMTLLDVEYCMETLGKSPTEPRKQLAMLQYMRAQLAK